MLLKIASRYISVFIFFLIIFSFWGNHLIAQTVVIEDAKSRLIGTSVYTLQEPPNKPLSINEVLHTDSFKLNDKEVLNLGLTDAWFWIKFTVVNKTAFNDFILNLDQANLTNVQLFAPDSVGIYAPSVVAGTDHAFQQREISSPGFLFRLTLPENKPVTCYLRLQGHSPLVIPVYLGKAETITENQKIKNVLFGIYAGIILCMLLYNLFLTFSIKEDKSYFWYVLHTLFVGLTQGSFLGFTFQYLWPDSPWLANQSIYIFTCLVSIVGIIFLQVFLNTKEVIPKLNKVFYGFFFLYVVIIALALAGRYVNSYQIMQPTQGFVALYILFVSIKMVRDGYKQARFYLISWSLLMIGIIIFALKDFNVVPYNNFTSTIMLSGSGLQVILLSFALADKINIYKADKEKSQEETLKALQENERIIRDQNVMLEKKVNERTQELRVANDDLNKAMDDLKQTQAQLVDSEKMASLGQLTAGIAHEINNPINFVTSNVNPLKRDVEILMDAVNTIENVGLSDAPFPEKQKQIEEYKEEIDFDYLKIEIAHLLKGINEGASRTAEIVKGLRVFSRLDEDDLKKADINEGLDSTLVIVNNQLTNKIQLVKEYGNLPLIECYPGKLNQVFLNIITNAIHAINKRYGNEPNGILKISTSCNEKSIFIKIEDNGTGMDENTKKKIFEPFFTTKEVGEGTGLGMSIAYNTIKKHNGQIYVNTTVGVGTEFILDIPIIHEMS
jgi:signal transduction histidine kinase